MKKTLCLLVSSFILLHSSFCPAWTITNVNIGIDSNSVAWSKVNNNNNNIAGVFNAQAVSNAWFLASISNQNAVLGNALTNWGGVLIVTNAGTGNNVVITNGQVLINGFPALTNNIHTTGTPTISTNVGGEYARVLNANGDQSFTIVTWFTNAPAATAGTKIFTLNFAHAYAAPPSLGYTAGLSSDGTYDGGMRPTLFVWGMSTTNATMYISSAASGVAPGTGKYYTNYIAISGQ